MSPSTCPSCRPTWKAAWIWAPDQQAAQNSYVYARKTLDLASAPREAVLRCCADTRYSLYVNGRFIGRGPARYHFSAPQYDVYDVTGELQEGRNVVAFLAHHVGAPVYTFWCVRAGLLAQLQIRQPGRDERRLVDGTARPDAVPRTGQAGVRVEVGDDRAPDRFEEPVIAVVHGQAPATALDPFA